MRGLMLMLMCDLPHKPCVYEKEKQPKQKQKQNAPCAMSHAPP
jgi:hypothetical protein